MIIMIKSNELTMGLLFCRDSVGIIVLDYVWCAFWKNWR